jgi:metal-responsive CopG/Arc/MetJ family transcriptional regulator
METICIKIDKNLARDMEKFMKKKRYSTKTELIREAIRDKMSEYEKKEAVEWLRKLSGSSKKNTTDKQVHRVRERLAKEYEKNPEKFFRSLRKTDIR